MILLHEAPESTYYGTPTASINYHSSTAGDVPVQTSATSASSATPSQTSAAPTGSSKSNAGPIAGGVVGGIVLLALIGVLVWWLIRRRQNRQNEQTGYYTTGDGQMGEASNLPAAVDYGTSYPTSSPTVYSGSGGSPDTPKLYNPDDPSTFPKTPASFGYQSTTLTGTVTSTDHSSAPLGRYKGAAEI
ncbi:hypothetical protein FS837_012962 [Tulasnella sp. UAMH 9824]|nr:hypothetical protein FS837_012962 [Tulasnella sp. UAMH 9824]